MKFELLQKKDKLVIKSSKSLLTTEKVKTNKLQFCIISVWTSKKKLEESSRKHNYCVPFNKSMDPVEFKLRD